MIDKPQKRWSKRLGAVTEPLLWSVFAVCSVSLLCVNLSARAAQQVAQRIAHPAARRALHQFADDAKAPPAGTAGSVIGRVEIKKIGLSVPILSDIDTPSLLRGAGHVPGTATAGGLGTIALAGHRDTFFRPVRNIQKGMDVSITDAGGTFHYLVDSTEIVSPEQVEVLAIRDRPELALVTCYPFNYIGSAPRRFIVHAHLLSMLPDE